MNKRLHRMVRIAYCVFWLGIVMGLQTAVQAQSQEESMKSKKMCWAHCVGWGFDHARQYDLASSNPLRRMGRISDRTLFGRNFQWDSGIPHGTRKQINAAIAYGFDGFCVDVVIPQAFSSACSRYFRDAEGTDFKVALCIDHVAFAREHLVEHLGAFIKRFRNHPNACLIDGRMVIFIYNPATSGERLENWQGVRQDLAAQGLDAYYLAKVFHEAGSGANVDQVAAALKHYEGFYDFGCNGFSTEEMTQRLVNARKAMDISTPDGVMVAGIAVGYIGTTNAFYRPFLNSGSLRSSWEAALASAADWVCITTWNDYHEHTQFEPSVINRDNLLQINREYLRLWRGQLPPPRPPQVVASYHEDVVDGDDLSIELLNFSYSTAAAEARVRLLDAEGELFHDFPPCELSAAAMGVNTLRLHDEQLLSARVLRVQLSVHEQGEEPNFVELHPIVRRYGHAESLRTIRLRNNDLVRSPLSLRLKGEELEVRLQSWAFAGKLELLCNGWPVGEMEIEHLKAPAVTWSFPRPERMSTPADVYVARITDTAERVGFSNPVVHYSEDFAPGASSQQTVIVSGSDFDENWPVWRQHRRISRYGQDQLVARDIPRHFIYGLRYELQEGEGDMLISSSGWAVPARLGAHPRNPGSRSEEGSPSWRQLPGADGKERSALYFDGNDLVGIAARALPYDVMSLDVWLQPEKKSEPMTVFSDPALRLDLDEELRLQFNCRGQKLLSPAALPAGAWSRVQAQYTGAELLLSINGEIVARCAAEPSRNAINSQPIIGNSFDRKSGFLGYMGFFELKSGL